MVSLESIRQSNLEASNLENLVAVFGMLLCVTLPRRLYYSFALIRFHTRACQAVGATRLFYFALFYA